MSKYTSAIFAVSLLLAVPAHADQASVRKPMQDVKTAVPGEPSEMNKSELTETLAEKPPASNESQRGKMNDAKKAARERAREVAAENAAVHESGEGATGQTRQRNKSKEDEDVARKTNKSEAARSKKKD